MAELPDGTLASGSGDKTVRIWNTNSGLQLKVLQGHSDYVRSLLVLPDGTLTSCSDDGVINLWNTVSGSIIKTLRSTYCDHLTLLKNGDLASASSKQINIWNTNNGSLINILNGDQQVTSILPLTYTTLISGYFDGSIIIWDIVTGATLRTLKGDSKSITSLLLLNDFYFASGSFSGQSIKTWDKEVGNTYIQQLTGKGYSRLNFLPDGRMVGFASNSLEIWNVWNIGVAYSFIV